MRMDRTRILRTAHEMNIKGARPLGRPQTRSSEEGCGGKEEETRIQRWKKNYGKTELNGKGSVPK